MYTWKYLSLLIISIIALIFASCEGSSSGSGSIKMLSFNDASTSLLTTTPRLYVTLDKTADQTEVVLTPGQAITVNYTVTINISTTAPAEGCYLTLDSGQCVYVTDTYNGEFSERICYAQGIGSYDFNYSRQIGPYEVCGDYVVSNTACVQYNPTVTPQPCCATYDINVHVPCYEGCTLTPGYWKTHSIYGPAPYDHTWDLVDENAPFYGNSASWHGILWTPPKGGNAYIILAHAYIAAFLNDLNGASVPTAVGTAMAHADDLLSDYEMSTSLSKAIRQDFIATAGILDQYNNGYTGPGHCSE